MSGKVEIRASPRNSKARKNRARAGKAVPHKDVMNRARAGSKSGNREAAT